ncbi:MAG: WYL domain-containing protein [Akkermansiaceae bacterium]|nr:WYL domain-containing protein [Akkermansiaceae bacterium]
MTNRTNEENWAAQERLRAIERAVWWRGSIRRGDLVKIFGISQAQASSDLQKYQMLNPGALVYQMSRKRYEGTMEMNCVLHEPRLEEGIAAFLGGEMCSRVGQGSVSNTVARVDLPSRVGTAVVERLVLMAVATGMKIRVRYWSVNSGKATWRWLRPHAFGHDGYRWHVRAWCGEREDYRDFVLSRIEKADWPEIPGEEDADIPPDKDWREIAVITLQANRSLDDTAQRAIEMDYGMRKGGKLKIKVREAMRGYLLDHLRIGREGGDLPRHFESVE